MKLDREAILEIIKQRLGQAGESRLAASLAAGKYTTQDSQANYFAAVQVEDELKSVLGDILAKEQETNQS